MITPRSCSLQVSNIRALNTWLDSWQHFMTVTCDNNVTMITDNISTFSPHGPFQFTASQALVCDGWASVRVWQTAGVNTSDENKTSTWSKVRSHNIGILFRLLTKKEGNVALQLSQINACTLLCVSSKLCNFSPQTPHIFICILCPSTHLIKFLLLVLNTLFIP